MLTEQTEGQTDRQTDGETERHLVGQSDGRQTYKGRIAGRTVGRVG